MNKLNIASRIAGGVTAGLIVYASHKAGLMTSAENIKIKSADSLADQFQKSRKMETRNVITSNLKDGYFRTQADWNFPDKVNGVTGYFGGAFEQAAMNIVPATLAAGALIANKGSKYFGAGLLLYGIKYLVCDVMDVGRVNYLRSSQ